MTKTAKKRHVPPGARINLLTASPAEALASLRFAVDAANAREAMLAAGLNPDTSEGRLALHNLACIDRDRREQRDTARERQERAALARREKTDARVSAHIAAKKLRDPFARVALIAGELDLDEKTVRASLRRIVQKDGN